MIVSIDVFESGRLSCVMNPVMQNQVITEFWQRYLNVIAQPLNQSVKSNPRIP